MELNMNAYKSRIREFTEEIKMMRNEVKKLRKMEHNHITFEKRKNNSCFCCWCGRNVDKYDMEGHEKRRIHKKNVELLTKIITE